MPDQTASPVWRRRTSGPARCCTTRNQRASPMLPKWPSCVRTIWLYTTCPLVSGTTRSCVLTQLELRAVVGLVRGNAFPTGQPGGAAGFTSNCARASGKLNGDVEPSLDLPYVDNGGEPTNILLAHSQKFYQLVLSCVVVTRSPL